MKVVMVDGPKSGEVISGIELPEILCFAIPRQINWMISPPDYDPYAPLWDTAIYRNRGSVAWPGNIVRVYSFEGMQ